MMKKVVVDTSVWIEHFRRRNALLLQLLREHRVLTHPLVIGELRCGTPPSPRAESLALLLDLAQIRNADLDEVLRLVEERQLYGKGCGLVDMALLVSALNTPDVRLWSLDKRMARIAALLGIPLLEAEAANDAWGGALTAASPTA